MRIQSLDILRGMTIAGMIVVNNPGGGDENAYAPLQHAEWIGLTPTDLVFPFFMFIMGMTTFLSLRHTGFRWSGHTALKVVRRALGLWLIGLAITWLFMFTRGMLSPENAGLPLAERARVAANVLDHIRLLGVMPRLGICYGLAAMCALTFHRHVLPLLILLIFGGYAWLLATHGGYVHDATNILAIVDNAVLGPSHVYRGDCPDPEGLLSTLPALAHVLLGFCVARHVFGFQRSTTKTTTADTVGINLTLIRLFFFSVCILVAGLLLADFVPISKKLWTPSFSLITCGLASLLLTLLTLVVDRMKWLHYTSTFFRVIGVNPLALFILSDLLLIPFALLPLCHGVSVQTFTYNWLVSLGMTVQLASLIWALAYLLVNWLIGLALYKGRIYIKL